LIDRRRRRRWISDDGRRVDQILVGGIPVDIQRQGIRASGDERLGGRNMTALRRPMERGELPLIAGVDRCPGSDQALDGGGMTVQRSLVEWGDLTACGCLHRSACMEKCLGDGSMAVLRRPVKRGLLISISDMDIGTGRECFLDGVDIRAGAPARIEQLRIPTVRGAGPRRSFHGTHGFSPWR
jgi:hypothetical protein